LAGPTSACRTPAACASTSVRRHHGGQDTLLPFKNTLYRLQLTVAQVRTALEDGIDSVLNGTGSGAYPTPAACVSVWT
jgi:hypothetical protein